MAKHMDLLLANTSCFNFTSSDIKLVIPSQNKLNFVFLIKESVGGKS